MKIRTSHADIRGKILATGFSCRHCGSCCTESEPGSNIVMVSPGEVRRIMAGTGLSFDDIVEPYPDTIRDGEKEYTFDWALRRKGDRCVFREDNRCSIYEVRPWICRTYPFMLDEGSLTVYPCPGICPGSHGHTDSGIAAVIAADLKNRQREEFEEEERIRTVLSQVEIPPGKRIVIDGEGMTILHS